MRQTNLRLRGQVPRERVLVAPMAVSGTTPTHTKSDHLNSTHEAAVQRISQICSQPPNMWVTRPAAEANLNQVVDDSKGSFSLGVAAKCPLFSEGPLIFS